MTHPRLDPSRLGAPAVLLLDVGQGDASLFILPGEPRAAIVVDCKDDHVVRRHLADFGVERLRAVVFTHLDLDHIQGGLALLRSWQERTESIYIDTDGRDLTDGGEGNKNARLLLDAVLDMEARGDRAGSTLLPPRRGLTLAQGPGWRVRLVAPFHGASLQELRDGKLRTTNEHSAVVRVERDTQSGVRALVIGGDAPLVVWSDLPDRDRRADVFRAPHHGGALTDGGVPSGWSPATLYDSVSASEIVLSVGSNNRHGHPAAEWRAPLIAREGCRVRCTQVTPACHPGVGDGGEAARLRSLVLSLPGQAEPAWRHLTATGSIRRLADFREAPCAGTVTVALLESGAVEVRPLVVDHDRVIGLWANPWCRGEVPSESGEQVEDRGEPVDIDAFLDSMW